MGLSLCRCHATLHLPRCQVLRQENGLLTCQHRLVPSHLLATPHLRGEPLRAPETSPHSLTGGREGPLCHVERASYPFSMLGSSSPQEEKAGCDGNVGGNDRSMCCEIFLLSIIGIITNFSFYLFQNTQNISHSRAKHIFHFIIILRSSFASLHVNSLLHMTYSEILLTLCLRNYKAYSWIFPEEIFSGLYLILLSLKQRSQSELVETA